LSSAFVGLPLLALVLLSCRITARARSLTSTSCPHRELSKLQIKSPLAQQKRRKLWVTFVCSIARRLGYEVVDEMERARQVLASLFYLSYPASPLPVRLILTLQRFCLQHQRDKQSHQALRAIRAVANPHRGCSQTSRLTVKKIFRCVGYPFELLYPPARTLSLHRPRRISLYTAT